MIKLLILAVMNNCTLFTLSLQKFALHSSVTSHAMYVDVQTAGGKSRKGQNGGKNI